jgi:hypothetical protein
MLPAHLMEHHPTEVRVRPIVKDHCLLAFVMDGDEYMAFCYCFTCKKGFVGDGNDQNHGRWITMHGKNTECSAAHRQHMAAFKAAMPQPTTEPTPPPPPPPTQAADIATLWEECRADKLCRLSIEEVETQYMDDVFEPAMGIRQLALNVASYKKTVKQVQKKMEKLTQDHEHELVEQRVIMTQQQQDIRCLHSSVKQLNFEQSEMALKIQALERKIALMERDRIVPNCSQFLEAPVQPDPSPSPQ